MRRTTITAKIAPEPPPPVTIGNYTSPRLEFLGTFRNGTLAGAEYACADGTSPFHRYAPCSISGS